MSKRLRWPMPSEALLECVGDGLERVDKAVLCGASRLVPLEDACILKDVAEDATNLLVENLGGVLGGELGVGGCDLASPGGVGGAGWVCLEGVKLAAQQVLAHGR